MKKNTLFSFFLLTFKYLKGGVTPKQTFSFCHFRQLFYSIYVNILCKHDIYHLYFTFAYLGFVLILWHTFNIQIFVGKQKRQYQLRKIDFKKIQTNPNFPFRNYKRLRSFYEAYRTKIFVSFRAWMKVFVKCVETPWYFSQRFGFLWAITLYYKTM